MSIISNSVPWTEPSGGAGAIIESTAHTGKRASTVYNLWWRFLSCVFSFPTEKQRAHPHHQHHLLWFSPSQDGRNKIRVGLERSRVFVFPSQTEPLVHKST
jgi:hypothetical protein